MSRRDHCPRCGREKWRYLGTEPGPHWCFACIREIESSDTPERAGARIAALEAAARAILPAAHAGIHFAFHEGNAVDEGTRYRAAYDALKALLEVPVAPLPVEVGKAAALGLDVARMALGRDA